MRSKAWVNDDFQPSKASPWLGIVRQSRSNEKTGRGEGTERSTEKTSRDACVMRCPSGRRPIDLVHLSAQTCGDRLLEREVLILLKAQLEGAGARLMAADLETRALLAHALKGAALNMGAFPLAESADVLEAAPGDEERLADLLAIIAATVAMVDRLIA